jgi:histidinol phosphatase-like PHP family hydrolase
MFSLSYKIEYNTDPAYPLSKSFGTCLGILMETEQDANEHLDLLAKRGTILETNLKELENYKPSKRVVYATTRSWE